MPECDVAHGAVKALGLVAVLAREEGAAFERAVVAVDLVALAAEEDEAIAFERAVLARVQVAVGALVHDAPAFVLHAAGESGVDGKSSEYGVQGY